jgi:hypothetical protein
LQNRNRKTNSSFSKIKSFQTISKRRKQNSSRNEKNWWMKKMISKDNSQESSLKKHSLNTSYATKIFKYKSSVKLSSKECLNKSRLVVIRLTKNKV